MLRSGDVQYGIIQIFFAGAVVFKFHGSNVLQRHTRLSGCHRLVAWTVQVPVSRCAQEVTKVERRATAVILRVVNFIKSCYLGNIKKFYGS